MSRKTLSRRAIGSLAADQMGQERDGLGRWGHLPRVLSCIRCIMLYISRYWRWACFVETGD